MGRVVRTLMHGWNAFKDAPVDAGYSAGPSMPYRQSRSMSRYYNDRSIIGSIYTRLSVDVSSIEFFHAKLDENDVATDVVRDSLHDCITLNPNIDQSAQMFKQDIALTMFENGHAAIVPIDATMDPLESASYDIKTMRVGRVVNWFPRKVTVEVYDDREVNDQGEPVNGGVMKQITLPKDMVAIVENPFYNIMNNPNGLLQRLMTKLAMLDSLDEAAGSGKLDIIFQLPYTVRGDSRKAQAEKRRQDLADQLKDDELGIGYIDVSEKVIQLNRSVENKLLEQVEYLFKGVMNELGLTPEIMNGSATADALNAYMDRTIEPIANAVAQEMKRKFLTKTARTQQHSIEIYRDPLKLIPISELAEVADKLIRNAILTANEFRPKIGYRPSTQPGANTLQNPNMPDSAQPTAVPAASKGLELLPAPKGVKDEQGLPRAIPR